MYKYSILIDDVLVVANWFSPSDQDVIEKHAEFIKSKLKDGVKFELKFHYPVR